MGRGHQGREKALQEIVHQEPSRVCVMRQELDLKLYARQYVMASRSGLQQPFVSLGDLSLVDSPRSLLASTLHRKSMLMSTASREAIYAAQGERFFSFSDRQLVPVALKATQWLASRRCAALIRLWREASKKMRHSLAVQQMESTSTRALEDRLLPCFERWRYRSTWHCHKSGFLLRVCCATHPLS